MNPASPGPVVGLIGAGGISGEHMAALTRLATEVVVFSEEGADVLAGRFGAVVARDLGELLGRVDVVDVVSPTFTHAAYVEAALRAGRHVIVEKPLARRVDDAVRLVALARDRELQLHPAHVVRWMPEYALLRRAVEDGALGRLAVLRFVRSGAFPDRAWFADEALSGGVVLDQMIHDLDVARWVAGEVVRVSAVRRRAGAHPAAIEAAHVLLTHESGAISQCSGLWGASHIPFTTEYQVTGDGGDLAHRSYDEQGVVAALAADADPIAAVDPGDDPYFLELRDFLGAIAGGPAPRVSAEDGLAAVRIAAAAARSIELGRPVEIGADGPEPC